MKFEKGKPRPAGAGRKKGTPNKLTTSLRDACERNNFDLFNRLIEMIPSLDKDMQVKAMISLMPYMQPKLVAILQQAVPSEMRTVGPYRRDFAAFCVESGYPPPYPTQIEMRDFVFTPGDPRLLLGSRGYGKTDYAVAMGSAEEIVANPLETSILLVTKSGERNASILREVATACIKHGIQFEMQNAHNLRVAGKIGKDNTMSALTIGSSSLRGRHPGLVIMDDPVTPEDTREAVRKQVQAVYEELTKICANIVIIGQPVHKYDLYETLRPIVTKKEFPHGSIPELDHDLEAQRLAGVSEESIQASYFLKVISASASPFDRIRSIDAYPAGDSVAFIDPSFTGGDFTALSIGKGYFDGVAIHGRCWKMGWDSCLDEIGEELEKYNVRKLCFEVNSLGTQPLGILRQNFPKIGVVGRNSNTNKHSRIKAAGIFAQLIHLSKSSDRQYTDQVKKYEYGAEFDDAPDSLASLLAWIGLIKGKETLR